MRAELPGSPGSERRSKKIVPPSVPGKDFVAKIAPPPPRVAGVDTNDIDAGWETVEDSGVVSSKPDLPTVPASEKRKKKTPLAKNPPVPVSSVTKRHLSVPVPKWRPHTEPISSLTLPKRPRRIEVLDALDEERKRLLRELTEIEQKIRETEDQFGGSTVSEIADIRNAALAPLLAQQEEKNRQVSDVMERIRLMHHPEPLPPDELKALQEKMYGVGEEEAPKSGTRKKAKRIELDTATSGGFLGADMHDPSERLADEAADAPPLELKEETPEERLAKRIANDPDVIRLQERLATIPEGIEHNASYELTQKKIEKARLLAEERMTGEQKAAAIRDLAVINKDAEENEQKIIEVHQKVLEERKQAEVLRQALEEREAEREKAAKKMDEAAELRQRIKTESRENVVAKNREVEDKMRADLYEAETDLAKGEFLSEGHRESLELKKKNITAALAKFEKEAQPLEQPGASWGPHFDPEDELGTIKAFKEAQKDVEKAEGALGKQLEVIDGFEKKLADLEIERARLSGLRAEAAGREEHAGLRIAELALALGGLAAITLENTPEPVPYVEPEPVAPPPVTEKKALTGRQKAKAAGKWTGKKVLRGTQYAGLASMGIVGGTLRLLKNLIPAFRVIDRGEGLTGFLGGMWGVLKGEHETKKKKD